ncbi:MAG: adenosine deaminase family protein [Acidobacteriota bacterium]|nr:adenosine deaminase family protein [Acidobacteriota bacterium]
MITEAFIQDLPKTDLHVHLDGSLRITTLIELARERGVELPSYSEAGLRDTVFKDGYNDLTEYLQGFAYTCAVMHDPESLERIAYELAWDSLGENVRYLEVRFAPMLHMSEKLTMEEVLVAVDRGLARAKKEFNDRLRHNDDNSPPFEYGIIACAMRMFTGAFSPYYKKITETHPFMPARQMYGVASLELARGVTAVRDKTGIPIVGLDLAGAEDGFPAEDHVTAFDYAHKNFLKKTVHAGEAYGAESIFQAITQLHADRIGHGYHLLDEDFIQDPKITNKAEYIRRLSQFIADKRVTIEVCLSSNLDTDPTLASIADHPFRRMKELKLSTTICTDNRLVSRTTVSRELKLAVDNFGMSNRDLKSIIIYGFKRSFFPRDYRQKRIYVRRVIDYYRSLEEKHRVEIEPVNEY